MTIATRREVEIDTAVETEKILLADDHRDDLEELAAILGGRDYEIVTATSGGEVLDRLRSNEFAVALVDVSILRTDGSPMVASIRERIETQRLPMICLSRGTPDAESLARVQDLGAIDCLTKPPDAHALIAKVRVLVDLSRKTRELVRRVRRDEVRAVVERHERDLLEAHLDLKRRTIDEAPIGIGFATLDGKWFHANQMLAEIAGIPADQLVHLSLRDIVDREDEVALSAAIDLVVTRTETKHRGEYRIVRPDGSVVWTAITISLLCKEGNPVQLTIVEDINQRKHLELALQESEVRFARLQESGMLAVAHEDETGTVTRANDAFLDLVGYTRDELSEGRINAHVLTPPEWDGVVARAQAELRAHGSCRTYEQELIRKDGKRVSVLFGAVVLERPRSGLVVFALDISQRKVIEIERARLMRALEDSVHARDDFLSLAAHELRHPLTPLLVQVTNLRALASLEKGPFPRPFLEWIDRQLAPVERSVRRLQSLIETLLDVSRMTVGRFWPDLEESDLSAIVRDSVEKMRFDIESTGTLIQLRADLPIVGRWDRKGVQQVVNHLVSNAVKYGAGKPIEVETSGDATSGRLSVIDHGLGIAADDRARIFERFERVAPLRHFGGFGLGLWVVRQIVDAHAGGLELWSEPGQGSRFTVVLPRAPTTSPPP